PARAAPQALAGIRVLSGRGGGAVTLKGHCPRRDGRSLLPAAPRGAGAPPAGLSRRRRGARSALRPPRPAACASAAPEAGRDAPLSPWAPGRAGRVRGPPKNDTWVSVG